MNTVTIFDIDSTILDPTERVKKLFINYLENIASKQLLNPHFVQKIDEIQYLKGFEDIYLNPAFFKNLAEVDQEDSLNFWRKYHQQPQFLKYDSVINNISNFISTNFDTSTLRFISARSEEEAFSHTYELINSKIVKIDPSQLILTTNYDDPRRNKLNNMIAEVLKFDFFSVFDDDIQIHNEISAKTSNGTHYWINIVKSQRDLLKESEMPIHIIEIGTYDFQIYHINRAVL